MWNEIGEEEIPGDEREGDDIDELMNTWDFERIEDDNVEGINFAEIPTEYNQLNMKRITYISPLGYVSEEEDGGDEEEEEGDGDDICEDEDMNVISEDAYEDLGTGCFTVGMTFSNIQEARDAVNEYGVKFRYKLKFEKSDPTRLQVHCMNASSCPFKLFVSKDGDRGGVAVKTAIMEHKCLRQFSVPSLSQKFLSKYFKDQIYKNPKFSVKDMQNEVKKHLKLLVSLHKCKRAKQAIIHELEGSYSQEFATLAAYAETLKASNPGTKAEIQLCEDGLIHGRRVFRRMFVMFDACKKNWLSGCRPILGLDGCFLKGVCKGQLLTAVGKDANDQVVPIAWAIVNKENKVNWRWFLCWLKQELELGDGSKVTIMSDMQKGLIDAVPATLPKAEHRWCARHIYANWSKKWKGEELKKRFWVCAWSTFEEDFKIKLLKLGKVHKQAVENLLKYPVQTWCRAYQSSRCCTFMVDNNMSESFNSSIVEARHKPIVSMLEDIRVKIMTQIKDRKKMCDSWVNEWSPAAMEMYQHNLERAIGCRVLWNGASGYEIGEGEDKHTVLLEGGVCTCRAWELTGIPCMHAIAAMYYSNIDPLSMISKWYHKSTYQKAYENAILPVPGIKFMKTDEYEAIEPPPIQKMPGRPRKKRIRASNEPVASGNKISKKGQPQVCSICKISGHKKTGCPNKASTSFAHTSSSNAAITNNRPTKLPPRRSYMTSNQPVGIGLHIDPSSGRTIFNPGLSSQRIIREGEQPISYDSDPIVRGPIPNEREINLHNSTLRSIHFSRVHSDVRMPNSLPFKPPGLQWNGAPSVTTRQLLEQRERRKSKLG